MKEGLILFKNENKLAVVLKTDETIFDYAKPAQSSNMAVTYLRYMIDICSHIIVVPSFGFKMNPDIANPFIDRVNPGFFL